MSRETRALAEGVVHYVTQEENTCSKIEESTSPGKAMTQCNLKGLLKLWPSKTTKSDTDLLSKLWNSGTQKTSRPGQRIQKAGMERAQDMLTLDKISPFLDLRGLSKEIAPKMTVPIKYNKYVYEYSSSEKPGFKIIDGQDHIFYINLIAFCLAFQSDPLDPLCICDPVTQIPYCTDMVRMFQEWMKQRDAELTEEIQRKEEELKGQQQAATDTSTLQRLTKEIDSLKKRFFAYAGLPEQVGIGAFRLPTDHVVPAALSVTGFASVAAAVNSLRNFETALTLGSNIIQIVKDALPWSKKEGLSLERAKKASKTILARTRGAFNSSSTQKQRIEEFVKKILQRQQIARVHTEGEDKCNIEHRWDMQINSMIVRSQKKAIENAKGRVQDKLHKALVPPTAAAS